MPLASVSNSIDIMGFHIRYSHQFLQADLNVLLKNPVLLLTLHVDYWLSWLVDGLEQLLLRVDIYYVLQWDSPLIIRYVSFVVIVFDFRL